MLYDFRKEKYGATANGGLDDRHTEEVSRKDSNLRPMSQIKEHHPRIEGASYAHAQDTGVQTGPNGGVLL